MKSDRNAVRAGFFMILTVVLIVSVILSINGIKTFTQPKQTRSVTFSLADDIGGLNVGDDVRVGGAKVGEIRKIEIDPDHQEIRVRFRVPSEFTIKKDARVAIQGTITGTSWLNFDSFGSTTAPVLSENDSLVGKPSEIGSILASLSETAPEIQRLMVDARTKTLPKFNALADNAASTAGHLNEVFGETKGDLKGTITDIKALTASMREKLPPILEKVDGTLTEVRVTITDLKATAATARQVVVGNKSKLEAMVAGLKTTSDNLKAASTEIRHSPWRLLYQPEPEEVHNLNLFDSARQFADGASQLNDAASALRDGLKNPDMDKAELQKLVDKLDKTFANFNEVETKLWQTVKE